MALSVLHVVESLSPQAGSVAICLPGLIQALGQRNLTSRIITADANGPLSDGVEHCTFNLATAGRLAMEADVVHVHGWGTDLAYRMADLARSLGRPYIVSPQGALGIWVPERRGWRRRLPAWWRNRRTIPQAAAIACICEHEFQELHQRGRNDRLELLPYGLPFDDYESDGSATTGGVGEVNVDGRCLLLLAPLHPVEGHVPLLKAMAELGSEANDWSVVMAGPAEGRWRKVLEAAIRRKGGENRAIIVPADDVATQQAWLSRASILVAPSLHVRCPVSILQAIAAGVPVVASRYAAPSGLNAFISVCGTGRKQLREALREIVRLPEKQLSVQAAQARVAAKAMFDWSVLAADYVRLYKELAGGRS